MASGLSQMRKNGGLQIITYAKQKKIYRYRNTENFEKHNYSYRQ